MPHLEYCATISSPYLAGDINALEKVQMQAIKLVKGYGNYPITRD